MSMKKTMKMNMIAIIIIKLVKIITIDIKNNKKKIIIILNKHLLKNKQ